MARPQKEGLDYFPHDVYAASDPKLEPILLLYGAKGYAFYFLHLEYIYRSNDLEFDISDAETREVIAQKLHISADEYNQILESVLKKNLFDKKCYGDTQKLTSNGVKKRASSVLEKRDRMRLAYEQKVSAAETTHIKESKVKESKVNNISIDDFFNTVWSLYPRKEGKGQVSKTKKEELFKIGVEEMSRAVQRYVDAKQGTEKKYLQMGSTFFNSGYVDYLDKNYSGEEDKGYGTMLPGGGAML